MASSGFKILTYRAFDPTEISGLKMWLDASTLTDADGSSVTTWNDSSGNDAYATQSNATYRPILKTSIQNNRNIVRFDGVDDNLIVNTAKLDMLRNVSGSSLFAVYKKNSGTTEGRILSIMTNTGVTRALLTTTPSVYRTGGRRLDADTGQFIDSTTAVGTTSFVVHASNINYQARTVNQYINGTIDGTSSTFQTAGNTSDTNSSYIQVVGSGLTLPIACDVAEIIVFNRSLTNAEMNNINNYLFIKWGIDNLLPTNSLLPTNTQYPK